MIAPEGASESMQNTPRHQILREKEIHYPGVTKGGSMSSGLDGNSCFGRSGFKEKRDAESTG